MIYPVSSVYHTWLISMHGMNWNDMGNMCNESITFNPMR